MIKSLFAKCLQDFLKSEKLEVLKFLTFHSGLTLKRTIAILKSELRSFNREIQLVHFRSQTIDRIGQTFLRN
ncbi:hypothetical protein NIES2135_43810 [Leptolyngbya boryana NIES-2135]|uniref:Uncharacterized protein n=1 Tax=Leptolyngbya boryana NIES-2135 TaxID=1973484 RepID=A0A1Z4JL71_LEPBY|nr:hypothetical protein NIES2135_43810 [Leptolyngbya boryana NIES-2135]